MSELVKPVRREASLYARPRLALEEVVLPVEVETGAADEATVWRVVGATEAGASVVVGATTATGVVEVVVGIGAGAEVGAVSSIKTAPAVLELGTAVLEAAVDAGTRTGVPSMVIVPTGTGTPVA